MSKRLLSRKDWDALDWDSVSILDTDFESAWAPPVARTTDESTPVSLDDWRVRNQGNENV